MPYVVRNQEGQILALVRDPHSDDAEHLDANHKDVIQFLSINNESGAEQALSKSDIDLARVIEDLIQLLVDKNNIMFTELPPAVQLKLLNREKLRNSLRTTNNSFLQDDDIII